VIAALVVEAEVLAVWGRRLVDSVVYRFLVITALVVEAEVLAFWGRRLVELVVRRLVFTNPCME